MLKSEWSKNELNEKFTENVVLAQIIKSLENEAKAEGKVICSIVVNKIRLSEEDEVRLCDTPISDIDELSFTVNSPNDLVVNLIEDWQEFIPQMMEQIDQVSSEIRFHGLERNLKRFSEIIDACRYLVSSLEQVAVYVRRNFPTYNLSRWEKEEHVIGKVVKDMTVAFEAHNLNELADIMEYDLNNSLQGWLEMLQLHSNEFQQLSSREMNGANLTP